MASTSISVVTSLITGATPDSGTIAASGDTCTITAPTGGALDFNTLVLRIDNTAGTHGTVATISVSSSYSSLDAGTAAVTVGSGATVYVGGKEFESARFKQVSAQSIVLTFGTGGASGTCTSSIEAIQAPYSVTG